jgi:divalent metal cation (Fe/Co/Zn/Cd) transporter
MKLIGSAFVALSVYLAIQSTVVLAAGFRPRHCTVGMVWTAITALTMFGLASGKDRTGSKLGNPVLRAEGRITIIDGILATAVHVGLILNSFAGWWWADPVAGYVLLFYALREARASLQHRAVVAGS